MSLDSAMYVVFLALVVAIYWRLRSRWQNVFLLAASYFFYGCWDWRFLLLIAASTCADYFIARQLGRQFSLKQRRLLLAISLIFNFAILCYFKYFNFFIDSFASLANLVGLHNIPHSLWAVVLPPAISFYTFQEVAYIVDVYAGKLEPASSLLDYALFISFFPHLIAGPIQRPGHLLPQVQTKRTFDPNRFRDGIMLILLGLFRKCVIADSAAQLANAAFSGSMGHTAWTTLIGAYAFALQIYGDFSGYSDIARGSAQLLGFHFMVNFRQPYLANSLQDFWRRWHISLSTWLRDYLYIPLGGNRKSSARTYANLLTTMLLGGLWHGASWNFVAWGGLHGGGLAAERALNLGASDRSQIRWLRRILVFHVTCLAWIFFRAVNLPLALTMLKDLGRWSWTGGYSAALLYLLVIALPLFAVDLYLEHSGEEYPTQHAGFGWQLAASATAVLLVAFASAYQSAPFIYFQF